MTTKLIPDLTIIEAGVGPAIDVWPSSPSGGASFPPAGDLPAFVFTPAMTQATWFVDPANSTGVASDSNSGIDAAHPVLTWNGGIVPKWGTVSPTINQDTTITWLSTQPFSPPAVPDPVVFTPVIGAGVSGQGATIIIKGVLGAAQTIHVGVIGAGLLPKNRSTGQLLTADLGSAALVPGQLVQNTTLGKASFAHIYQQIGVTSVYQLSQPLAPVAVPYAGALISEVDTWAVGDAFTVFEKVGVDLSVIAPTITAYDVIDNFPAQVSLYHLRGISVDGSASDNNTSIGNDVTTVECRFDDVVVDTSGSDDQVTFFINVAIMAGAFNSGGADAGTSFFGGLILGLFSGVASWSFDFDAILDSGASLGFTIGSPNLMPGFASSRMGLVYIAGQIFAQGGTEFLPTPAPGSTFTTVWGSGLINGVGSARLVYGTAVGAAVATFLNTGGLKLNGQTTATTINPATSLWLTPFLSITPAHLDAPFAGPGFAGLAINPGGASFTNQATA